MKKDQHIIVCIEKEEDAPTLLNYANLYAKHLNKGVIAINASKQGKAEWISNLGVPYVAMNGEWKTIVDNLPSALGGVLAVCMVDPSATRGSITHSTTMLRTFRDCKTAYLIVSPQSPLTPQWPTTVALTLDHRRESKEKLIWASYMVRFFGSRLQVATPTYKDADLHRRLGNNLVFLSKMFRSLGIDYTTVPIETRATSNIDICAIEQHRPDLLIAMTTDTREHDIGDLIFGSREKHLVQHPSHTPLLLLNQRDDLYVLCD